MLTLVAGPEALPLSLPELKAMPVLADLEPTEDAVIAGLLRAALAEIDGAAGWLNRALISQVWIKWCDAFPPGVLLVPLPPLQDVIEIRYLDTDGIVQTLDPTAYTVAGIGGYGRVVPSPGMRWPATRRQPDAVQVEFRCGFGDSWNDVPEDIRASIARKVAAAYDGCESAGADSVLLRHRAW